MTFDTLATILNILRTEIGDKKDMPVYWLEFFLLVSQAGPRGVTTKEVAEEIGMGQPIASRMVKLLSRYPDPVTKKMEGADIYVTFLDHEYRHRTRVALSAKGQRIAAHIKKYLEK